MLRSHPNKLSRTEQHNIDELILDTLERFGGNPQCYRMSDGRTPKLRSSEPVKRYDVAPSVPSQPVHGPQPSGDDDSTSWPRGITVADGVLTATGNNSVLDSLLNTNVTITADRSGMRVRLALLAVRGYGTRAALDRIVAVSVRWLQRFVFVTTEKPHMLDTPHSLLERPNGYAEILRADTFAVARMEADITQYTMDEVNPGLITGWVIFSYHNDDKVVYHLGYIVRYPDTTAALFVCMMKGATDTAETLQKFVADRKHANLSAYPLRAGIFPALVTPTFNV